MEAVQTEIRPHSRKVVDGRSRWARRHRTLLSVLTGELAKIRKPKLPRCLIGIEACASSHHWSRELQTLGHTVRLMPPAYVKPYVKRQKNDTTDAEAICEAVT